MSLTKPQLTHLKKLAHSLKPVVMVGQHGVSEGVLEETNAALLAHELIKMRISAGDRDERDEMIQQVLAHSGAELVQRIGNVAVLFRANPKKKQPMELPT
jgi:RNA-binding protein